MARRPFSQLALCSLVLLGLFGGCANRTDFTPAEFERVEEQGVRNLRVYPNEDFLVVYAKEKIDGSYEVNKRVEETERRDEVKLLVGKKTAGQVLEVGETNGARTLFVTFDPSCTKVTCAFGFVEAESGQYRLGLVPPMDGHSEPQIFRKSRKDKNKLGLGKVDSLAELNDVFISKRKDKIRTINLEIVKVTDSGTRTKVQKSRGIE